MRAMNGDIMPDRAGAGYGYSINNGVIAMSIKNVLLATGIALSLVTSATTAFADPYIAQENAEQRAVSAQERLVPATTATATRERQDLASPSAFGTPGLAYAPEGPFQSGNAHWGAANDADQD